MRRPKLMPSFSFLEHPAIHPRLSSASSLIWPQQDRQMALDSILCPGLPAELYHSLCEMPLQANQFEEQDFRGMSWRCSFQVPAEPDPQHAESFYRLHRFLEVDLIVLAEALLGQKMKRIQPGTIHLLVLRKGSFVEAQAPTADHVGFLLSLTVGDWPVDWGNPG